MIRFREIAFTAYPSADIARSRRFYEGVLGLTPNAPVKDDAKWIEYNLGPGTLGVGQSPQWKPSADGPSSALEVEDFDAAVKVITEHKIKPVVGPLDTPVCRMVTIQDPDGNKLTLHQRKAR